MQATPISAARAAANRANGLRFTGPKTPEGKARSSQNALKHGLLSERSPLDAVDDASAPMERAEFLALLDGFTQEFAPATPLETRLVERLAHLDLRLTRAMRVETAHIDQNATKVTKNGFASPQATADPPQRVRGSHLLHDAFLWGGHGLEVIERYESRLSREFARTLKQLQSMQDRRATNDEALASCAMNTSHPEQHLNTQVDPVLAESPSDVSPSSELACEIKMNKQTHQVQETRAPQPLKQSQAHRPGVTLQPTLPASQDAFVPQSNLISSVGP